VISTNTWSILSVPEVERRAQGLEPDLGHWIGLARLAIRLSREALDAEGRSEDCAVAFAISEEVNSPARRETIELLARVFAEDPPDLVLLETMTLIRDESTYDTVELLLETGLPVWLSFRRCRHGVRPALGSAGRRSVWARRPALRENGRRRHVDQLLAGGSRARDDFVAA
jgi:hypothetical protein